MAPKLPKVGRDIKATQVLGYVEEKLRRVFNLAGQIGVTLDPAVKPVILVDDLRDPGHAFYQGRGFVWSYSSFPTASGVGAYYVHSIQARDDIVTEFVWASGQLDAGASTLILYLTTPDEVTPVAGITFTTGAWRDRRTSATDVPPLLHNNAWQALTGTAALQENLMLGFAATTAVATQLPGAVPLKIFVPRGGCLNWRVEGYSGTTALNIGFAGRVFPQ